MPQPITYKQALVGACSLSDSNPFFLPFSDENEGFTFNTTGVSHIFPLDGIVQKVLLHCSGVVGSGSLSASIDVYKGGALEESGTNLGITVGNTQTWNFTSNTFAEGELLQVRVSPNANLGNVHFTVLVEYSE